MSDPFDDSPWYWPGTEISHTFAMADTDGELRAMVAEDCPDGEIYDGSPNIPRPMFEIRNDHPGDTCYLCKPVEYPFSALSRDPDESKRHHP